MKFYDAAQVHACCEYPALVTALEQYHREDIAIMEDMLLKSAGANANPDILLVRSAWQQGQALGTKLATGFFDNPNNAENLPAVQAVYVLFDGTNGKPLAVLDGTALTYRKTAADSALASHYLARQDVNTLLMVGAGGLAPHLIMAHCAIRPAIERVLVWNRTEERAQTLATELAIANVSIEAIDDLATAATQAQLISCATLADKPLIHGEWLQAGTHLDLVGSFTPTMREADDTALQRASIFVDARATTINVVGELMIPMAAGVISEHDILADHYDLARQKHPGRQSPDEITVFKNGGGGHLDLMTARFVVAQTE